jgi:SOS-response transcriptional repressor LexA
MNKIRLVPETPKLAPLELSEFNEVQIWGVVTYVIKTM